MSVRINWERVEIAFYSVCSCYISFPFNGILFILKYLIPQFKIRRIFSFLLILLYLQKALLFFFLIFHIQSPFIFSLKKILKNFIIPLTKSQLKNYFLQKNFKRLIKWCQNDFLSNRKSMYNKHSFISINFKRRNYWSQKYF